MRRFSSEGSLLDMDVMPWRGIQLKDPPVLNRESGTHTHLLGPSEQARSATLPPTIRELGSSPGCPATLTKDLSVSVEDLKELSKRKMDNLRVGTMGESFRAYSDGQLAPSSQGSSTGSLERDDTRPSSPSDPSLKSRHHRERAKAKLSAAKLHLKSLFELNHHSSNSNISQAVQKDSAKERRSRLRFMRQWSQVGHSGGLRFSLEALENWARSLNDLLASQEGVSVFGAFLRSEFSEENLQFYLACGQYQQSSNNFSLQRRAKDICTTYIQPGSPREVNLDSKTRDLTLQLLQAPSHTSLLPAQKRIYSLLDADCYPRFLQSPLYLSLLEDAR
ncbi:regulator of G-protein signaling 8 [Gadus morhua]|uniref:RGS domain-containing protein n=1 Tax=Gadus morhua TaxID=8049 RepID=A0A8C5C1J8_GADMO|nr:regulator of G-protein signaling 8-like [Gadus morhua]XP_030203092.1 regulator of G-protein signaling 8-like [Gadus morhua]XP_030203093.1 regulator of G-protein signaling 8-like [Gadus morhua]XP_030203094.1 regulator of G-protein signaling 8-like [Gadus morhua]